LGGGIEDIDDDKQHSQSDGRQNVSRRHVKDTEQRNTTHDLILQNLFLCLADIQ
jgi:hypothetical protein